jgi:hypothetical protein
MQNCSTFALGGHHLAFKPLGAMLDDPVCHCFFKPDVVTSPLGFIPLVLHDLLALGLKLPVKQSLLEQIAVREPRFCFVRHNQASRLRCKVHGAAVLVVQVAMVLHSSALIKGAHTRLN